MNDDDAPVRASITDHFVSQIDQLRQEASQFGFERLAQSLELAAQIAQITIDERKRLYDVERWRDPHA
jgi:hypothetical protein